MTMKQAGKSLTDDQCDELWTRVQAKKYAFGFGRDSRFIDRCYFIQCRLSDIKTLRRFAINYDIHAQCVLEANAIYLKRELGEKNGSSDRA